MIIFHHLEGIISVMASYGSDIKIPIGVIDKQGSFTPIPTKYSDDQMKEINKKVDEVRQYGIDPPKCHRCSGTPYFPNKISIPESYVPVDPVLITCLEKIHNMEKCCHFGN